MERVVDHEWLELHVRSVLPLKTSVKAEPDCYIETWEGALVDTPEGAEPVEIGQIQAKLINLDGWLDDEMGVPLFDIFDAHSGEMCDLHEILFDETGDFVPEIENHRRLFTNNVLVIERLQVSSECRSMGLGSLLVQRVLGTLGQRASFAVVFPAPIELLEQPHYKYMEPAERAADSVYKEAVARLAVFYRRLGFTPLANSRFWRRNLEQS